MAELLVLNHINQTCRVDSSDGLNDQSHLIVIIVMAKDVDCWPAMATLQAHYFVRLELDQSLQKGWARG